MAIARLLSAVSASVVNPANSFTQSVVLSAGANRMLLVTVGGENLSVPAPSVPVVTYGGLPLTLMRGPLAIFSTSSSLFAAQGILNQRGFFFLALLESDLATLPLGANDLAVTWDGTTQTGWEFAAGWSLLSGVKQSTVARSFNVTPTTVRFTTIGELLAPGAAADAVFAAGINNGTAGTIQITFNGAGVAEDFDVSFPVTVGRFAGAALIPVASAGPCTFDMTYTLPGTFAALVGAIRLEAFDSNPGTVVMTTSIREHPLGQAIPLRAYFANVSGVRTNPSVVTYRVGLVTVNPPPDPSATDATFGSDPNVTNPGVGEFLYSLPPPATPGNYVASVVGSGAVQAAATLQFRVLPNPFA